MKKKNFDIRNWLKERNEVVFSLYAVLAAFSTYACMYAFRKPFAVAGFAGLEFAGIDYKTLLVLTQLVGYTLSKFIGIKVISEMTQSKRASAILLLIGVAQVSLFLFAVVPHPYNFIFMFFNGLPLGMVWGLVFSFLEGRRTTEILGAGLSISFIVSSGFVKSVGKYLMLEFGISEFFMPFATGLVFTLPLLVFVWMLSKIPPPSEKDEKLRTRRIPMQKSDRKIFFKKFASGIVVLTLIYMVLTAFRDMRDNFMADVLTELGYQDSSMIFTYTEIPIAFAVLVIMGSLILIKDNIKALLANHFVILAGIIIVGASTLAYQTELIEAPLWLVFLGLGLYMGYVPFNCILFDRFIATYKTAANAGFLIYIADSFGYLASGGVLFFKNFGYEDLKWSGFFINTSYVLFVVGGVLTITSIIYFLRKNRLKKHSLEKIVYSNIISN